MAVKLDKESGCVIDDVVEMREVMVRTGSDRCTLAIDMTINNHYVEAVVDSGAQVSVLSRKFYDSLSCRPKPVESIRLKGASASGVMVGCRVDGVEVDLGDGHGNYSMTMYVANITDNCILGLDYLKAHKAVIDLSQGVLVVNDTIVKGKYKYAEATPVRTHKVRLVNDCHLFPNSVSRATVRIQTDDIHTVVVQARTNEPYLVSNTLLMPGDASLYIMNDSDSHIQLKDDMVVAVGQEALHIEEVSESDGVLTKWNGQSVQNQSNSSLHLDGIIGMEGEDDPSLTGNSGTISRVEKDEDIQELKSKAGQLDSNKFRDILIVRLPDHMKDMFQRIGEELSNDQLLRVYLLLISRDMVFLQGDTDLGTFTAVKHHIDTGNSRPIKQRMRRTPLGYANEEQEHLEKLLKAGVIEPSCSEWASPSVLVRKRDGSVRWCIDLRKLNDVTVKDCYPLPLL